MKYLFKFAMTVLILVVFTPCVYGQSNVIQPKTTYEKFVSDVGTMITKDFYDLPTLRSSYKNLSVKIIGMTSTEKTQYFFAISAKEKYSTKSAIIAQADLIEINKALKTIVTKSKVDLTKNLEYRERYFTTNDGFKVGYYQQGIKQVFFINLANYQSDDAYFFDSFKPLIQTINGAEKRITGLK